MAPLPASPSPTRLTLRPMDLRAIPCRKQTFWRWLEARRPKKKEGKKERERKGRWEGRPLCMALSSSPRRLVKLEQRPRAVRGRNKRKFFSSKN
jgi:hypothetical protein